MQIELKFMIAGVPKQAALAEVARADRCVTPNLAAFTDIGDFPAVDNVVCLTSLNDDDDDDEVPLLLQTATNSIWSTRMFRSLPCTDCTCCLFFTKTARGKINNVAYLVGDTHTHTTLSCGLWRRWWKMVS